MSTLTVDPTALDRAISLARDHLLGLQAPAGYWVGELEADASVTAGYIPLMHFMTGKVDPAKRDKAVRFILSKQIADGSWPSYAGGPGDLNVTAQVYFALKLAGLAAEEPLMTRARQFILSKGGLTATNTLTRIFLAIFGQYDWRGTPSVPVELMLLPRRSPFNIYDFASWSRATIVALMIILDRRPVCPVPPSAGVEELFVEPPGRLRYRVGKADQLLGWESFFYRLDIALKTAGKLPVKPGHRAALRRAERWVIDHQESDGSWGGIMLPWVYSLIALKSLGHTLDSPIIQKGLSGLTGFVSEDDQTLRLQPATSPVWDTAWAVIALRESGLPSDHPALVKAARWLLDQEVQGGGDWQMKNHRTRPGAWAFEFDNDIYPDIDDTAVVPRALLRVKLSESEERRKTEAIRRGLAWAVDMQGSNGGWAAFDRNNNKRFLEHVPFADFMTPLDPTSPDVTAHVIDLLGEMNERGDALNRALVYLRREQEPDGAWYGRWGVNYIYGTGLVLASLRPLHNETLAGNISRAAGWLKSTQHEDGGWGESCGTYDDPRARAAGPSTASQTAWALLGLIGAGEPDAPQAKSGIDFLTRTQRPDGSWQEDLYTGTGFPRAFYLHYDLYRIYFPLLALAQYRQAVGANG